MEIVNFDTWFHRQKYEFFKPQSWPFWSVTFPVDVTDLHRWSRERGLSFYYALTFLVTKAMDSVDAFHYKDRGDCIVYHDHLVPSFSDLKPGSEDFYFVTLEPGEDMEDFCRRARETSMAQRDFLVPGPWDNDQCIYVSCLPWIPFTALSNDRDSDPTDSVPRVTWGKYVPDGRGRGILSMTLNLNHRLLDGVHAGRFYERLTALLEEL